MLKLFTRVGMLLGLLVLAGCTTNSITSSFITNLTPPTLPKNDDNVYRFEAEWNSNQKSIREGSFKAWVMIDDEFYPMLRTPMLKDRWEALVPLDSSKPVIHYRFKFEYLYNRLSAPSSDSKLSPDYSLILQ